MLGLNNVQIIGNLGGTPEMKYLNNNDHVVNFSVAINERWKNRNGEPQERTTWLRIVAFNGIGSACAEHLKKGDGVYVEGRLQLREYEDKGHVERTSVEVVASRVRFLGRGNSASDEQRPAPGQPRTHAGQSSPSGADVDQSGADDVPF
jgi:single-strand DNA-binding protein